jgi:hypothetical protein
VTEGGLDEMGIWKGKSPSGFGDSLLRRQIVGPQKPEFLPQIMKRKVTREIEHHSFGSRIRWRSKGRARLSYAAASGLAEARTAYKVTTIYNPSHSREARSRGTLTHDSLSNISARSVSRLHVLDARTPIATSMSSRDISSAAILPSRVRGSAPNKNLRDSSMIDVLHTDHHS